MWNFCEIYFYGYRMLKMLIEKLVLADKLNKLEKDFIFQKA